MQVLQTSEAVTMRGVTMASKKAYLGRCLSVEAVLVGHCLLGQGPEWHLLQPAEPAELQSHCAPPLLPPSCSTKQSYCQAMGSTGTRSAELVCVCCITADDSISRLSLQYGWYPPATNAIASCALKGTAITGHCLSSFKFVSNCMLQRQQQLTRCTYVEKSFIAPLSWISI